MKKILLFFCVLAMGIQLAHAQTRSVTGKVTEKATGSPIPGVAVTIKGTKNAVSSDANGIYKIAVPSTGNVVLVFNSIGFNSLEEIVGSKSQINVALEESATTLNEVKIVNIGYGTVKREAITGAVSSVGAATIAAAPVSSALEAIQGRVAGVNIATTEGSPDAEINVRVRGGSSITQSNEPLYIVDGFPVNTISDIAPQDIESIDILKDASSTAIYGSRGANGVILVTTKSSRDSKTSISYNLFGGFRKIANTLDVLTPADYVLWQYEHERLITPGTGSLSGYTDYFGAYEDMDMYQNIASNDWQNIVFGRRGNTINHNLSIMGGSDKTKYSLSHNFVKDRAIMMLSGFQRQNINFKLNHKIYKSLSIDLGLRYSDSKINGGGANETKEVSSADSRLKYAVLYPPFSVPGLTTADNIEDDFNLYTPTTAVSDNDQLVTRRQYTFTGALSYDINNDLKFRSDVGYEVGNNTNDRFYGLTTYYVRNVPGVLNQNQPALTIANSQRISLRNTNTLNYNFRKLLPSDHNLTALIGQEYLKVENSTLTNVIHGYPTTFSFDDTRHFTTLGTPFSIDNAFAQDDKLLSFFGRANYDYKGKYLLSVAFRADGSSKFAPGNQWGYFPSVSAAWRIIQEDFMSGTKSWLSDLKLRASYGESGNNNIPTGQVLQAYSNSTTSWINGASNFWSLGKIMYNPDLKWETTVSRNIGLDFGLFNNKVTATADVYLNNTKDLLVLYPITGVGYETQYRNIGETQNKGLELGVNYRAIQKKNFDLGFNANISFNRNKVVSLGAIENINGTSGWASTAIGEDYKVLPGMSLGQIYGYKSAGRYEVSDFSGVSGSTWTLKTGIPNSSSVVGNIRPGQHKLVDINGDGVVNTSDRTIIGNALPKHTGGFSLTGRLFDFDFAAYFNWSYGNDVYNANKIEYTSTGNTSYRNLISQMASGSRWTNLRGDGTISNDPAELTAMNANTTLWSPYTNYVLSDWAIEDGSFLRLSTVTLGYTLPTSLTNKIRLKKVRFYSSVNNVFVWTNYSGYDPEVSTRRSTGLTPGVDYSAYPRSRSVIFGLNVNF
ncbi:SusC/RagA family TonB-linked outer membrane protein [Pedobacter chitinilyticus]|uniref:TonB-dependent receptor n=1 Tax=Pedobacter chitinilyticus TaxID=2233776 RepID=A0A3S3SUC0_9SPHI|nr:TonB-dependent receptor [Pedobacter chitinilyticus]RWU10536.1 TonB-dependent receptor [Pedobacter chitinilyticus]